jgi:hypothetical protein
MATRTVEFKVKTTNDGKMLERLSAKEIRERFEEVKREMGLG